MTIEELNQIILNGEINEFIRVTEARQVKAISKIADLVCGRPGIRLVLLAGGSSAGKTTTTKRLATQIRVNHREAMTLSTDDYFVGDAKNPRDENGRLDYEHLDCVDIPALVDDLTTLFAGGTIRERRFDFAGHCPRWTDRRLELHKNGIVVLEGTHALNPRLSPGIADEKKFRVYVDPKPDLEISPGTPIVSADARFLRRLVRDNQFRKISPSKTYELWPNVLAGEKKWIEPFRGLADATFDSYLSYEAAALKPYAGGLLERLRREIGEIPEIKTPMAVFASLGWILPDIVPGDSILREAIGGSQLEY